jgi:hypothetical protein
VLQQNMRKTFCLTVVLVSASVSAQRPDRSDAPPAAIPTIAARTAGMTNMPGLLPLHWDPAAGKLYLEISLDANGKSADLLYTNSLPYGTGSNDLGLDRGQTSQGLIVHFERIGPKVLLVEPNERFRTSSTDPNQQLSVKQSFPSSVLGGFTVAAQSPDGSVMVDATDFFLRDVHGVAGTLARMQQGAYRVDPARSTIDLDSTKAFPKNTEVDAMLTFVTDGGGGRGGGGGARSYVAEVSPDAAAMTVHEHQSFLELPPPGYTPRAFDPRAGYGPGSFRDYDTALGNSLDQQFIHRHRLIKKDPNCTKSCEPVAPIQYYVDSGAPEMIRNALLEGARWWDQAFQLQGRYPAGRRRPDGRALQHDPVGAPLYPRLELRRLYRRPTDRRDHQGQRHAGLTARAPGLHDRRGIAEPLRTGQDLHQRSQRSHAAHGAAAAAPAGRA